MQVEDGEDGTSAGEGADAHAARAYPSEHAAAPAWPASASDITVIVLALVDTARAAAGSCSEGQQGWSGSHR
jgi:hypothetical protein